MTEKQKNEILVDLTNASCHVGLCEAKDCCKCSKVVAARNIINNYEGKTNE